MLSKREFQILKLLVEQIGHYLTSQDIALSLEVSGRTVRKYLHLLEDTLKKEQVAEIKAKQGSGYKIIIRDKKKFSNFCLREIEQEAKAQVLGNVSIANDRQYYILNRLFFEQSNIYVDDIAEELFVSRSTISNELAEIKRLLSPYDIELQSKNNQGIYIVGQEKNIRHFIMSFFFMDRLQDNMFAFSIYANLLQGINIEGIVMIVLDECRKSGLKLSDFIVYNLVLHIGLAIKRIHDGFEIDVSLESYLDFNSIEYKTALKIISRIEESDQIHFPKQEAEFITMHLKSRVTGRSALHKEYFDEVEIREQLLRSLVDIDQIGAFDLTKDEILIEGLMVHFLPLLTRLQNQIKIENPLTSEIKSQYADLFTLTVKQLSQMPIFTKYEITDSEWAYIVIHVIAAVERFYNHRKARVIVICTTGLGSAQLIRNRLEREFGSKISIEKVISYYEVANQDLSKIDLIISSINLGNITLNRPILEVSVFLNEEDIQKINQALADLKIMEQKTAITNVIQEDISEKIVLLKKCFKPELFYCLTGKPDKEQVLSKLVHGIESIENRSIAEIFFKQIKLRESYSSVVFSNYLAVPHPIEAVTNKAYVAVAVVPEGVIWDGKYDGIQLVFLLSPDKLQQFEIEKVSQLLILIMEDDQLRKQLSQCESFESFIDTFIRGIEKSNN
ncbi:BglG family transcription antiterminator [Enterococcus sp. AZ103]|uniref:BglG family transcription antiterminator n=1 Tax=Enterococcus sp. AZ103 TaxID=2774628 RepID=UPI003F248B86